MKWVFFGTNITLGLLGETHPFYEPAAKVATLADQGTIKLVASPLSFATANYILSRFEPNEQVKEKLRKFNIICTVGKVDHSTVEKALHSKSADFEDAFQYFAVLDSICNVLLTRNHKDFKLSAIAALSAEEYLETLR